MNWDALTAVAELLGAVAVAISLGYLALQIRFSRLAAADTSRSARAVGVRENLQSYLSNPELRANWLKAADLNADFEKLGRRLNLEPDGAFQINFACLSWMWLHWGQYKSMKTKADLEELEHIVSVIYSVPPMLVCWHESPYGRNQFDDDFVSFVEACIAKTMP